MFHASLLLNRTSMAQIKEKVYDRPPNILFSFPMVGSLPDNVSCNGHPVSKCFASQGHLTSLGSDEKAVMLAFMIGAGCPQIFFQSET